MGPGPLFEQKWLHGSGEEDESVISLQHRRQQCQCRP